MGKPGAQNEEAVTHARQEQRGTELEISKDASSYSHLGCTLFFDTIPQELLSNVLKFLSLLPYALNWSKRVPLNHVMELYRVNGGLGTLLYGRFHTLCISKTADCVDEQQSYKWKVPSENVLCTDSINVTRDFVLKAGGSLRTIIIGDDMYDEDIHGRDMVADFVAACPNVRSLSVVEELGGWSSAFSGQLGKLDVAGLVDADAFPKNCPRLLELNFENTAYRLPKLSMWDIKWGNIGSKLESLTLSGFSFAEDDLERIREHCKHLRHIDLRALEQNNEDIAKFIVSYGDRLDTIQVYNMSESELNEVAGACVNARFLADIYEDRLVLPTVRILESLLKKIMFSRERVKFDAGEWSSAWNSCSNLEVLEARGLKSEEIRAIMAATQCQFKEIRIYGICNEEGGESSAETILNTIAEGTRNLQTLYFQADIPSLNSFNKIIDRNKSALQSVTIINHVASISQLDVGRVVGKFLECPLLQNVSLDKVPAESVLNTLRGRGVHFRCLS